MTANARGKSGEGTKAIEDRDCILTSDLIY